MHPIIQNNLEKIRALCQQYHVKELYAFGSVVRDDFGEDSDVDLLYVYDYSNFDFNLPSIKWPTNPADDFFNLKFELEALLGKQVDLVSLKDLKNPYFLSDINKEKIKIYGKERLESIPF